jgi:hypothetical protein
VLESVSRQQLRADRRPSCAIILSQIAFACFAISFVQHYTTGFLIFTSEGKENEVKFNAGARG